jgi:hypothetical protein
MSIALQLSADISKRNKGRRTLWLDTLFSHNVDFTSKDLCGGCGRIDTVCLDGDDDSTTVLEEVVGVEGNDTCLIGLSDIGKDDIDHLDEHSVFLGVTSVFYDRNSVGT